MNNNTLMIAAAGSGKTTLLATRALEITSESVLIVTYTESNEQEIRSKIIKKKGYFPSNITVQTWFSFLLQHGVRPYQSLMENSLHEASVGFFMVNEASGVKLDKDGKPLRNKVNNQIIYWAEKDNLLRHYFTSSLKIYSDKASKFVVTCDDKADGEIVSRISRVYDHVFIDEVQDLAGYDLEIIKRLFRSSSEVLLVGDPRQVTYQTHHAKKYPKYADGKIKEFVENELGKRVSCSVDEETLNVSHRNNAMICSYSAKLYPGLVAPAPCRCETCRKDATDHEGVFLVRKKDVDGYLAKFKPVQLRWSAAIKCNETHPVRNMGESKGATLPRVLIYPTADMARWINDNNSELKAEARAKFYVALTRARHSSAIVMDFRNGQQIAGMECFAG